MIEDQCLQARQTVDDTEVLSPEQLLQAEKHIRSCPPCTTWRNQANAIAVAGKAMPLFDVPESLTQRIMADVHDQAENKFVTSKALIVSTFVLVAFAIVFSSDSIDTANGAISWLIGFILLFGLKALIQANTKSDVLLPKH